jgi:trehalose 6-phosphate phosphatase
LPLWTHLAAILQRCVTPERCALFLDYDGTLTPIVEDPDAARLSPTMQGVLHALTRHPRYRVALVSGRALADLRSRVDGGALCLAGNHGLEIEGPGLRYEHPEGRRRRHQLEALRQTLQRDLDSIPGAWVEDKGLTLSVHFRRVPKALAPKVQERVTQHASPAVEAGLFTLRTGKAVLEIRPHVPWDKGEAVRWLLQRWRRAQPSSTLLAIYIGDDDTDEDAFRVLGPDGVGIVVGRDRMRSTAHYYLESVEATARFLALLASLKSWG